MQTMEDKPLPSETDIERAVLGTCFMGEPDTIDRIAIILRPEHFYNTANREAFKAILAIHSQGAEVDVVSVVNRLQRTNKLDAVGGPAHIASITTEVATVSNAEYHARMVREAYQKRHIITTAQQVINQAHEPMSDLNGLLGRLGQIESDIATSDSRGISITQATQGALSYYEQAMENPDALLGLPSNIDELDEFTAGFQDSDLILLGARPGEGKTSCAVWWARAMASKKAGLFFNLEMSGRQVGSRFLTAESGLVGSMLRRGMNYAQHKRLKEAMERVNNLPITIFDDVYDLDDICALTRQHKRENDIGWVVIDYLQLVRSTRQRNDNREQQVANISSTLKQLAKDLNIPVIALSQLSRLQKGAPLREPRLDDLRESGSLEQDANVVIFLFRPYVHGKMYQELDDGMKIDLQEYVKIIIAKQREGEIGSFKYSVDMGTGIWKPWNEDDWLIGAA